MNLLRRFAWTPMVLAAALAGCGEEPAAPAGGGGAPAGNVNPDPASRFPSVPAEKKDEAKKEEPKKEEPKKEAPKKEEPKKEETKKAADAGKSFSADQIAAIKELGSDADIKLAMAQATCPVGNDTLGEMGKPVKVTAKGKTFFLCCAGCEKEVKANPDAVVAKLDKK